MWPNIVIASLFGVVAAIIVLAVARICVTFARRRRLKRRFGAEYGRLADDVDSKSQADAELVLRERYVSQLGVHPLDQKTRDRLRTQWLRVLVRFTRDPVAAVMAAQRLLVALLRERGYPVVHREQVVSDLSVDHADLLEHFRSACEIFERNAAGMASEHDLRQVQTDYIALFTELLADPTADASAGRARDEVSR